MKLSDFIQRLKLKLVNIGQTGITDDYLTELINQGCDRCNERAKFYTKTSYLSSVADQAEYAISGNITDYLGIDNIPIYFKLASGKWKEVYPKTKQYIQRIFPDFVNATSVTQPQYYYIDGDRLNFYPAPNVTRTDAIRVEHLKTAEPMVTGDDFPYTGSTTEITGFRAMDEAIIAFVIWQIEPSYGKVSDTDLGAQRFQSETRRAKRKIKRRPDANGSPYNGMRL